jgi:hypothetical protein
MRFSYKAAEGAHLVRTSATTPLRWHRHLVVYDFQEKARSPGYTVPLGKALLLRGHDPAC